MKKTKNKPIKSKKKELEEWKKNSWSNESIKKVENSISHLLQAGCDPISNIRKFSDKVYPKIFIEKKEASDEDNQLLSQIALDNGIDNDYSMLEAVEERYRGLLINIRRGLIKKYDCKTTDDQ